MLLEQFEAAMALLKITSSYSKTRMSIHRALNHWSREVRKLEQLAEAAVERKLVYSARQKQEP